MEGNRNIMQRGGTHLINIPFNAYNDQGLALCWRCIKLYKSNLQNTCHANHLQRVF